jgi:peptidoglycan hydrolase-like protein with peptidoglycan-binding domain
MAAHVPTIAECQAALKAAGFDPGPIDNLGGHLTQAAILKFQAARGLASTGQLDQQTINALFPAPPSSNPLSNPLVQIGLNILLSQILKGLPMGNLVNFAAGAKSFILGALMVGYGAAELLGWNIPEFGSTPPGALIAGGLALITLRLGINNAMVTAVENLIAKIGQK